MTMFKLLVVAVVVPGPDGGGRLVAATDPHQVPQPDGAADVPAPPHPRHQGAAHHPCAALPLCRLVSTQPLLLCRG